jgi:protein SCO1/2
MRPSLLRTLGIIALALAALTLGVQLYLSSRAPATQVSGLRGTPLQPARSFEPVELTDQRGASARLPIEGAAYTLVFFGYTHCPDVCPLGMSTLARADRELGHPKALGLAFVTVDPSRDTPAALATFTRSFDSRIVGFTSEPSQLGRLWNQFGVLVEPASREFVHGESIYLVDANGHILLEYPPDGSAADIAGDVRTLLRA